MTHQIIIAGFGGQGIMSMGQLLTYAGMLEDKNVSWLPSYGPEMRGGTANCNVIISNDMVASPIITEATAVIAMNRPSLEKFENSVVEGGLLLVNSSLIDIKASRDDIEVCYIRANEIADRLGNSRVANMVMLGAYLGKHPIVNLETIEKVMKKTMAGKKEKFICLLRFYHLK